MEKQIVHHVITLVILVKTVINLDAYLVQLEESLHLIQKKVHLHVNASKDLMLWEKKNVKVQLYIHATIPAYIVQKNIIQRHVILAMIQIIEYYMKNNVFAKWDIMITEKIHNAKNAIGPAKIVMAAQNFIAQNV